eukprot:XP_011605788.1 PREDICTED: periphilin-1-like isoform X2 [Takifugu rubripes]
MAFQHGRRSIREAYAEHFSPMDAREVTVHRVLDFVERHSPVHQQFERGFGNDQWFDGPRNYACEQYNEGFHPSSDQQYFDNPNFHRNSPPLRHDAPFNQRYNRQDLRHQLNSRKNRVGPHFRKRGRGSGPPQNQLLDRKKRADYRSAAPAGGKRERSPSSRESQPPVRSGSSTSSRSFTPDRDRDATEPPPQKIFRPNEPANQTSTSSVEEDQQSSSSSTEKTAASVAETEEVAAASMEPTLTPEEDFKARRLKAIRAKAVEIEKLYRQDCETFRTVVKMLVEKEPALDNLLQISLDKNLQEIKQRCLDDLRHFVKELDEATDQNRDVLDRDAPQTSSDLPVCRDDPQLCSIEPTSAAGQQQERKEECTAVEHRGGKHDGTGSEICKPGKREMAADSGEEDNLSNPAKFHFQGSSCPPQQDLRGGGDRRLQLYTSQGEKLSNVHLSNPTVWQNIGYIRAGWAPSRLPFLPSSQYWKLKANSTVVATRVPSQAKDKNHDKEPCGVTCYMHNEGPWCEIQADNGTLQCLLAALPAKAQGPPGMRH